MHLSTEEVCTLAGAGVDTDLVCQRLALVDPAKKDAPVVLETADKELQTDELQPEPAPAPAPAPVAEPAPVVRKHASQVTRVGARPQPPGRGHGHARLTRCSSGR